MRFARFNVVGALGLGVQLSVVAGLVHGLGAHPVLATATGIVAALFHNFAWHVRWTWRDRMSPGVSRTAAFVRFVSANGVVSLAGSILLMPVLLGLGLAVIPANLVSVVACGVANYWLGACLCFKNPTQRITIAPPTVQ